MTLHKLLEGVAHTTTVQDCEVRAITCDSRQVEKDSVFFCIPGLKTDGHDYAPQAVEAGACAIVCERDLGLPQQVLVDNVRKAYGKMCSNYFGNPSRQLKLLGVTGTNGKTTTTYLVKSILEHAGKRVGLIGTIHNEIGDMVFPAKYTTPEPFQLHAVFARMVEAGCEYVVMEVSSHALEQLRVEGCHFACAAFTNLTQDHLDYHHDMESYYQAKKRLFSMCDRAVLNYDDEWAQRLAQEISCPHLSFSCEDDRADYSARDIRFSSRGSRFALLAKDTLLRVRLAMPGMFSVANGMTAAVMCIAAGICPEEVAEGLSACPGVPGRIEILPTGTEFTVIRDYAHSPDGLEKVLQAVREFAPGRIVTLFGCAGNRDRAKRPIMAEIVARLSDFCILTSDNPRDEDPVRIINDALPGLKEHKTPYKVIVDRYEAIEWALSHCSGDDVLILAGKGHEDYQVLAHGTIFFDEKVIVQELLERRKSKQ